MRSSVVDWAVGRIGHDRLSGDWLGGVRAICHSGMTGGDRDDFGSHHGRSGVGGKGWLVVRRGRRTSWWWRALPGWCWGSSIGCADRSGDGQEGDD